MQLKCAASLTFKWLLLNCGIQAYGLFPILAALKFSFIVLLSTIYVNVLRHKWISIMLYCAWSMDIFYYAIEVGPAWIKVILLIYIQTRWLQ